jgi:hypothetical protein
VPAKRVRLSTTIEIPLTLGEVETACREWAAREFGGRTIGTTTVDAKGLSEASVTFDCVCDSDGMGHGHDELRGATVIVKNQVVADEPEKV